MQYTNNYSLKKPQLLEPALITDLNNNADAIDTLLYQNRRISSAEYDQNASYAVGDLVVYENLFYRCIGVTSGNWDSTKWVRTTLASEVIDAKASGGSDVEGNPTGTATAQLEKLRIDNDIFFINDASKIIAAPYDSTSTYAVGDYCIYNTLLYKCTTAITTAGAWDSTKWTPCVVTDEMGQGGGGSSTFAGLTDVDFTNLTDEDFAQYDATAQKWKNVAISGVSVEPVIYSTEEHEIGVWIDGKPVYKRVFDLGQTVAVSYNSWTLTTIDLTGIERLISISALNEGGNAYYGDVLGGNNNNQLQLQTQRNNQAIGIRYLVMQYTKTTDTAGSGIWTPQGVPAVHYSTDEQIVGTWIDGSTIYEKTLINTADWAFTANTWSKSEFNTGDIQVLIDIRIVVTHNNTYSTHSIQGSFVDGKLAGNCYRAFTAPVGSKIIIRYTKSST